MKLLRIAQPQDGGKTETPAAPEPNAETPVPTVAESTLRHDLAAVLEMPEDTSDTELVAFVSSLLANHKSITAELQALKAKQPVEHPDEKLIREKMDGAKCTREQAIGIIQRQREHDARKEHAASVANPS